MLSSIEPALVSRAKLIFPYKVQNLINNRTAACRLAHTSTPRSDSKYIVKCQWDGISYILFMYSVQTKDFEICVPVPDILVLL